MLGTERVLWKVIAVLVAIVITVVAYRVHMWNWLHTTLCLGAGAVYSYVGSQIVRTVWQRIKGR